MKKIDEQKKMQLFKVLKKAQTDKALRTRLLANADATLKQEGMLVPGGHHVKFIEREKNTHYYFLPEENEELSEEQMVRLVAGAGGKSSKEYCISCGGPY